MESPCWVGLANLTLGAIYLNPPCHEEKRTVKTHATGKKKAGGVIGSVFHREHKSLCCKEEAGDR